MSYGFRVFNQFGDLVLDDNSFPFTGVESGPTNGFSEFLSTGLRGPISVPTDSILFLSQLVGQTNYIGPVYGSEGQGEIHATGGREYVIARPYYNTNLPDYGLAVFNPSGQVVFHTGASIVSFRESASRFFPVSEGTNVSHTFTISSDVTHIAMFSSLRFTPNTPQNIAPALALGISRDSATSLSVQNVNVGLLPRDLGPFPVTLSILTARIV